MKKQFLLLSLAILGLAVVLGCGSELTSAVENPVSASAAGGSTVSAPAEPSVEVAVAAKSRICHFDVDDDDPDIFSVVIVVANTSLNDHFAHGDCLTAAPVKSVNCGCN
ncbi:hypothetical protein L0222_09655 [bacterium]|nr:hypothetical protein [bacterium]MCI0602509.1 hypothetical protein [bacterium]